ncbi:MAG: septum formation initiator family protein [Acetatifactor sp.]|nr:septum formation initiator family protein [Acetatifactor sp.]
MARTRRRVEYRKKTQNRFSMILVGIVVACITVMVLVKSTDIRHKIELKAQEEQLLDEKILAEEERAAEIDEFGKEVQTKGYIEDMAREKLGLVYEGEILFKEEK